MTDDSVVDLARHAPKTDLHCHLTGSVAMPTLLELSRRHGRPVPEADLRSAYDLAGEAPATRETKFFAGLDLVASLLRTPDDLALAVHSIAADSARRSGLRYLELFVNPTALQRTGMSFVQVRDGLLEGARAALTDDGVRVRFIACFLRDEPVAFAEAMLDDLIRYRTDDFVGVGLDGPELLAGTEAERFAAVYQRAGRAGLRRTVHLTETSATDLLPCLDLLGCERIDHGYPIVEDPAMLARALDSGVSFTCCLTITRDILGGVDARYLAPATHPTTLMLNAGVPVVFGTDDGALVNTDIGKEYALAAQWYAWSTSDLEAASLRGLDAAWIDDTERAELRREFAHTFRAMTADR